MIRAQGLGLARLIIIVATTVTTQSQNRTKLINSQTPGVRDSFGSVFGEDCRHFVNTVSCSPDCESVGIFFC